MLVLWGSDGVWISEQVKHVAHCPLPVLHPIADTTTMDCVDPIHYWHCGRRGDERRMVLCGLCNEGYHSWCVTPCLDSDPVGH